MIVLIFCFVGGIFWLTQNASLNWEPRLHAFLEDRIGKAIQGRAQFDSISISFIHRVRLNNVRLWLVEPAQYPVFQAAGISLTLSMIDLPRAILRHNPIDSIGLVTIEAPVLRLSPAVIAGFKPRHSNSTFPLLFTLAWQDGILQWKDPSRPKTDLSFYKAQGAFRIRGPRISLDLRASTNMADDVRLHAVRLGRHRWTAQTTVDKASIVDVIVYIQSWLEKPFLPALWGLHGRFHLDLSAGGRDLPKASTKPWTYIEKAHFVLENAALTLRPGSPPIDLKGGLLWQNGRLNSQNIVLSVGHQSFALAGHYAPFLNNSPLDVTAVSKDLDLSLVNTFAGGVPPVRGPTNITVHLGGFPSDPDIQVQAQTGPAEFGIWPIDDALVILRYRQHRLEFVNDLIHSLGGQLHLQGFLSSLNSDLQILAENLSINQLKLPTALHGLSGRVNLSCQLKGELAQLAGAGSYWLSDVDWDGTKSQNIHGNFELDPSHFETNAASEDNRFHFSLEGDQSPESLALNRLQLVLPSGSTLSGQLQMNRQDGKFQGSLQATDVNIPRDTPFLRVWAPALVGTLSGHVELSGTTTNPVLKATLTVPDLALSSAAAESEAATAVVSWRPGDVQIDSVHIGSSVAASGGRRTAGGTEEWNVHLLFKQASAALVSGLLAKQPFMDGQLSGHVDAASHRNLTGDAALTLDGGHLGRWPLTHASLKLDAKPSGLEISALQLRTDVANLQFQGRALHNGSGAESLRHPWRLTGRGLVAAPSGETSWNAPFELDGSCSPADQWAGKGTLKAPHVWVQKYDTGRFDALLNWTADSFSWQAAHWGDAWKTEGQLGWSKAGTSIGATLHAAHVSLANWFRWLKPNSKDTLGGLFYMDAHVNGSLRQPSVEVSGHIEQGQWRALRFDQSFKGILTPEGLHPLTMKGTLPNGGTYSFDGAWEPSSGTVNGRLTLAHADLAVLGQSLSFPKPLGGFAQGSLQVGGPLGQLHWAGRVETGPLTYAASSENPVHIQSVIVEAILEPLAESKGIQRLTIKQAQFRTAEELVRFNTGGHIDFAGMEPAGLQIGTEIRNLHLGLFTLFGGLDLTGTWQIRPDGFAMQGDAHTRSLFINDYELEEGHVSADYYNGLLQFHPPKQGTSLVTGLVNFHEAPQLHFDHFFISGKDGEGIHLTGDVGPRLWNFQLAGDGLDIGSLAGLAGFPYPMEGQASLAVRGTGNLAAPHIQGKVNLQDGRVFGLSFRTGTAELDWQNNLMAFTKLILSDPGRYTLQGAGVFPTAPKDNKQKLNRPINFSVRLENSNLGLLQSISKDVKQARGSVTGLVQIKGTENAPQLQGNLRVTDGQITNAHYFKTLKDLTLDAEFQGDSLHIKELAATSGEGRLMAGGTIAFSGFEPTAYDLHADVISPKGLDVQVPELAIPESPLAKKFHFLTTTSRGVVKGQVTFKGPADAPVFHGKAQISNGHFSFPPSRKNPPPPALLEWFQRINWDVALQFMDGAWFENELVEANLIGTLNLKGPSEHLKVDGGMDIPEGKISYLGIDFDIREARFDMRSDDQGNTVVNTPYVKGLADSQVQAIDTVSGQSSADPASRLDTKDTITLTIDYAPIDQIKPRLTSASNPTLSQDKLLARVTQLDAENLSPQEKTYLYQQQMVRLIDTSLATPLAKNILKRTGLVDNFRVSRVIDPSQAPLPETTAGTPTQTNTTSLLANTKYTVEKNLSSRLSLGYGIRFEQNPTADIQQSKLDLINNVELSYRWFYNVYLRGSYDLPSSNPTIIPDKRITIEPRIRFGWWGNTNKEKQKQAASAPKSLVPTSNP